MSSTYPQAYERHGIRYTLLEAPRPERARLTFKGTYQGQDTLWDATLQTAQHRSCIEIGDLAATGRALTVALAIPVIDEPAILRTIIMIRQYKRLRAGRQEFGTPGPESG